jgi:hypothetical protein
LKTYQDLSAVSESARETAKFVLAAISDHKASAQYKTALDAELYYKHQNPTIMRYQKYVHDQFGRAVPDIWSPNNKIASNWYNYFTTQAVQYLLGNGVTFKNEDTKAKLGRTFDKKIQDAATAAKNGGVSFALFNLDHIDVFSLTEFVPLYDEETGGLKAGIRFWQIDDSRPLRATLYELDGYTEFIKRKGDDAFTVINEKRTYQQTVSASEADGESIVDGRNYPGFPIVPLYNTHHQSDIVGNRSTIDAYDLMISGLVNNVSAGEFIYWVLKNCGGMTEEDDARFLEQLLVTHVAHADGDDGASVDAHKVDVPFEASAEALDRLEKQLFKDFMALNVNGISAGATNDEIQAAYEPLNQKTDNFEYQVTEFIQGILELAGIEDEPTYTRSQLSNRKEIIDVVLAAAEYLDEEYVTEKILTLLGDTDKAEEVIARRIADEGARFNGGANTLGNKQNAADGKFGGDGV